MATIKELIERAMLKIGSASGQASTETIDVVMPSVDVSKNTTGTYIAPCDGILYARAGLASGRNYIGISSGVPDKHEESLGIQANTVDDSVRTCLAVKKGCTTSYSFIPRTGTLGSCYVVFFKSVGGGITFLKRLLSVGGMHYAYA